MVVLLCTMGIVQIYSTTAGTKFAGVHWKQVMWVLLGLSVMFLVCFYDYHELLNHVPWMYLASLGLLVAVLVMGSEISGARRWLNLWGVSFQVSETVKLVLILLLARFFSEVQGGGLTLWELAKVGLVVAGPAILIALQPDLGTALTLLPIALIMLFLAGLRLRYFGLMLLAGLLAVPVGFHYMKPYQKARLTTFLNPEADPQKSGYQIMQSKIAVGSGQLWGKGTAQGTQAQLRFLPEPHTDFIFASFAEEHGFFGTLFALFLYFLVLMRLLHGAQMAPDAAGMYIIAGIAGVMVFQIAVNVGMVVGYAPITGIPLPLMSYGGSSVVFTCVALGLANSIRLRRFVN